MSWSPWWSRQILPVVRFILFVATSGCMWRQLPPVFGRAGWPA
ncbi:hypothetical protein DEJ50_00425 [Streptomyces venezuelae]|uniref:Transposase n=1 Tax=Streptomyces venezuelae TaxID=54571 RepID=A0A5P2D0C1_STRVZ|nr:hypothetical protein DEJ50_00425 [Streptomyces venezuelae]